MTFGRAFGGTIVRPRRTFRALSSGPRPLAAGIKAVLTAGCLYALAAAGLAVAGALVTAPPVLKVDPENYYFWEMIFALPVFAAAWLTAGIIGGLAGARGGRGVFKGFLGSLGLALAVPSLLAWIPQAVLAVLLLLGRKQADVMEWTAHPGPAQMIILGCQVLAVIWMFILTASAAGATRKLGRGRAAAIGAGTALVFLLFILVFIR
jgi:hypothetical protein